ncbi:hypothetical protein B4098_1646 [Heyndrickxia coagulans]|uniref:Uncharacterized protein n=1 Tax=Heyndrickxia coagulans TaxID=1398 RepID=A0A150K8Z7_HEYCO|nr:hypothetical protein B4098_1646 [Heyndrickxia coagulans]
MSLEAYVCLYISIYAESSNVFGKKSNKNMVAVFCFTK